MSMDSIQLRFRLFFNKEFEDLEIRGKGAVPVISLCDSNGLDLANTRSLDIGLHSSLSFHDFTHLTHFASFPIIPLIDLHFLNNPSLLFQFHAYSSLVKIIISFCLENRWL